MKERSNRGDGCVTALLLAGVIAAIGLPALNETTRVKPLLDCDGYIRNADLHFNIQDNFDTSGIFGRKDFFENNKIIINSNQNLLTFLFGHDYPISFSSGESVKTSQVTLEIGQSLSVEGERIIYDINTGIEEKGVGLEIIAVCK